jgi:hypothetical protein
MVLPTDEFGRYFKHSPTDLPTELIRRYIVIDRRTRTVGKSVGEWMKYRQNMSVCKFVGNCGSYCYMPTD